MKKLPIIRHIRFFYHAYMLHRHLTKWERMGFLYNPQQSDFDFLNAVWDGKV